MADDGPDSIVLRYLREIRAEVGGLREDMREVKTRIGRLEELVAGLHVDVAGISVRMDRFGDRLERVERRLDLREVADA